MNKQLLMVFTAMLLLILAACGQTSSTDSKASDTKTEKDEPKIASLSIHLTNDLLALGITPVGSVVGGELNDFLPHVKNRLKNSTKLGPAKDPDMEAVIALDPSVIYIDEGISGRIFQNSKTLLQQKALTLMRELGAII